MEAHKLAYTEENQERISKRKAQQFYWKTLQNYTRILFLMELQQLLLLLFSSKRNTSEYTLKVFIAKVIYFLAIRYPITYSPPPGPQN